MKLKQYLFIVCSSFITISDAQVKPSRLSFEINAGAPIAFSSIPAALSTFGGVGLRYNITPALSVQTSFNLGILRGAQSVTTNVAAEVAQTYIKYHNTFYQYTFRGQLNLERVFKLRARLKRINPYLTGGVGYTGTMGIEAERFDGRLRKYDDIDFWTIQCGVMVRYYLNPTLDLNIGSELNLTQTAFLDGIPLDQRNDHFLLTYVGINVKIGAKKKNQHIEWSNRKYKNKKIRKQPEDPEDIHTEQQFAAGEPDPEHADSVAIDKYSEADSSDTPVAKESMKTNPSGGLPSLRAGATGPVTGITTASIAPSGTVGGKTQGAYETGTNRKGLPATKTGGEIEKGKSTIGIEHAITKGTSFIKTGTTINKGTPLNEAGKTIAKGTPSIKSGTIINKGNPLNEAGKAIAKRVPGTESGNTTVKKMPANGTTKVATKGKSTRPGSSSPVSDFTKHSSVPIAIARVSAPIDPKAPTLNLIEGISRPKATYNVIVGAFRKSRNAYGFRNRMRKLGYQSAIFRSDINSQIMRVCLYSTENKEIALKQLEKARAEIEPHAWIHIYRK